jgi:sulfide:quinone oxidoreductase
MIRYIDSDYAVAGQLAPEHMKQLADAGFRSVINNRPDGEDSAQTPSAQMQAAAVAAGLQYVYLPVGAAYPAEGAAVTLKQELARLPKPILAYCRSGARSPTVYSLAKSAG